MKLANKALKLILALIILGVPLAMPLSVHGEEMYSEDHTSYIDDLDYDVDLDDHYPDESYLLNEDSVDAVETNEEYEQESELLELTIDYNVDLDAPIPAIEGYVPEIFFVDDTLLELEETEIFEPLVRLDARNQSAGSGLVQFVLEPIQSSLPSGVTMAQARAAAFNADTVYHPLFATATAGNSNTATSVNGRFGRDALFLGTSANGNRFRVLIAGFEGYVNTVGNRHTITVPVNGVNRTFDVRANAVFVPFGNYPSTGAGNVQSASHYVNRNGELFRYLTNNAGTSGGFIRFLTGLAPSWMSENTRYYSYDGVYFYRNPRNIRANGSGAVNANNPFFNYFQYLSFRSASTVTASELDNFLTNNALHGINTTSSVMRNQGNAFVNAQNRYGVNAILMYAKAMHESRGGTSQIALNNNNLFGQGAIDAAPGTNAWAFATPADSINNLADGWLSRGYLWPSDWRYEGPHVGHKGSGMNRRYATDPYWGQKIAGWAFRIDRSRAANSRDINREQIAIRRNTAAVNVTNSAGTTLYTANPRQGRYFPFLVTATATNNRLRILTDPAIVSGVPNRTARFNRSEAIGFIPSSDVWLTGASRPNTESPPVTSPNHEITILRRTGVTLLNASFREGPSTNYTATERISGNTNVLITGRSGNFYRVLYEGRTGWVRTSSISQTRQNAVVIAQTAHIREGRSSSRASLTQVEQGQRLTITRRTENWSRVTVNGHTGWIRNRDIATENAMRPGRTTSNNVQVHARPRTNSNVRHRLPQGSHLMIIQRTTDGWSQVRIRHDNGTLNGWVRTNQIENRLPNRRMARDGALRRGPGNQYSRMHTIPNNERVTIRSRVGNWYHVTANVNGRSTNGWIHHNNLRRLNLPQ